MKFLYTILITLSINLIFYAQSDGNAFHPMTAPGAVSVTTMGHILYWENPDSVFFNIIYFSEDSSLVANQDPSVIILSGEPETVYDSVLVNGTLSSNTKYYWAVAEWYLIGNRTICNSSIPLWYFYSLAGIGWEEYSFDYDLEGWEAIGPQGTANWYWSNTSHINGSPGEIVFDKNPLFTGTSYIMSPEITSPAGFSMGFDFHYYLDFNVDTAVVGFGITTDNGNSWQSLWELNATGDVGPGDGNAWISLPGNFRMGFYYTGNSNNINYFYADDIMTVMPLTLPASPPSLLKARASYTEQHVTLNWDPGWAIDGITGYQLQRQDGLPEENNPYLTIAGTDENTFTYIDTTVDLNHNYTYRIATYNPAYVSYFSNEATAYVPPVTPVELMSFTANYENNNVTLSWTTSTETNNKGFEIQRSEVGDQRSEVGDQRSGVGGRRSEWKKVGFVEGSGTTTESKSYSFVDNLNPNLSLALSYRLKQIDFDGSCKYSNEIELNVSAPNKFSLEQNYPNPFNPETNIKFSLKTDAKVTLNIYNVLGQKVSSLVDGQMAAGEHNVKFSASEMPGGGGYASGIYFYNWMQKD